MGLLPYVGPNFDWVFLGSTRNDTADYGDQCAGAHWSSSRRNCYVSLDPEVKDRFGLPVARLHTGVHPVSLAVSDELAKRAHALLDAAGARSQGLDARPPERRYYPVLQAGTARMGTTPRDSVVDSECRAHDVPHLYIADGSPLVSTGGAPYTLTIMANALRVARAIVRHGA